MRAWLVGLFVVVVVACHAAGPIVAPSFAAPRCEPGWAPVFEGDSDVGWGEVEETEACARRDAGAGVPGRPEGPAIETVASAPDQRSTKLVGRLMQGRRVGTWMQYEAATGRVLGRFTLDDAGSGTEEIHDQLGHTRRGAVVAGEREGTWTDYDEAGRPVATQLWSRGKVVRATARPPWDPPMMDPADRCPDVPTTEDEDDGCPAPAARSDAGSDGGGPLNEAGQGAGRR